MLGQKSDSRVQVLLEGSFWHPLSPVQNRLDDRQLMMCILFGSLSFYHDGTYGMVFLVRKEIQETFQQQVKC